MKRMKVLQDLKSPENRNQIPCPNTLSTNDPNQILRFFSEILEEYNTLKTGKENWNSSLKADQVCLDLNNNETEEIKKHHFKLQDINNNISYDNENFDANFKNSKIDLEEDCSDICDVRCPNYYKEIKGRYVCCCTKKSINGTKKTRSLKCEPCSKPAMPMENVVDIIPSTEKTFDTMHLSRKGNSSTNENFPCTKKKTCFKKKCGNECEKTICEESAVEQVVKNYAKDHSDRSNFGKSFKEDSSLSSFKEKSHTKIAEEPDIEQRKKEEEIKACNEKCSFECNSTSKLADPMLITKNQGLMEVHIVSLQLSKTAVRLLFKEDLFPNASFFISWDIRDQKTAFTPVLKYPKLNYDSSSIFVLTELFDFLDYIFKEYITFQVHVLYPNETTHTIAQTKLCVKEVLDYPHNKMQYIATVSSIIPCSLGTNFGQLSLWIRLSCDLDKIKGFKAQQEIVSEDICQESAIKGIKKRLKNESDSIYSAKSSTESVKKKQKSKEQSSEDQERIMNLSEEIVFENKEPILKDKSTMLTVIGNTEIDAKQENGQKSTGESYLDVSMVNLKNITSKSTSEITENEASEENDHLEISVERDPRPKIMKAKINKESSDQTEEEDIVEFKKMLSSTYIEPQVDSDSTLHDIQSVFTDENWDKYRQKALEVPYNTSENANEELIVLEVKSISLFQGTFIFLDPDIKQLYVEYTFLGYSGENMETKSLPLPKAPESELIYNFKKEFLVDEATHHRQRYLLRQMLKEINDPTIKFFVVSEPLNDEQDKDCKEVGFAQLNLKDYISGSYSKNMSLSIFNPEEKQSLGILRITVDGIEIMKNCL